VGKRQLFRKLWNSKSSSKKASCQRKTSRNSGYGPIVPRLFPNISSIGGGGIKNLGNSSCCKTGLMYHFGLLKGGGGGTKKGETAKRQANVDRVYMGNSNKGAEPENSTKLTGESFFYTCSSGSITPVTKKKPTIREINPYGEEQGAEAQVLTSRKGD